MCLNYETSDSQYLTMETAKIRRLPDLESEDETIRHFKLKAMKFQKKVF